MDKGKDSETTEESQTQFGISGPISSAFPTELDHKLNKKLVEVLERFNLFENKEGIQLRQEVLGKLNIIVREWIRKVGIKQVDIQFLS
jgi:poly(A) polymerase